MGNLEFPTLIGMPVQWKPWANSTRFPSSLWYADANTSCAWGAQTGRVSGRNCAICYLCAEALPQGSGVSCSQLHSESQRRPKRCCSGGSMTKRWLRSDVAAAGARGVRDQRFGKSGDRRHLGQREGVAQVQKPVHVGVRERPEEFLVRAALACRAKKVTNIRKRSANKR